MGLTTGNRERVARNVGLALKKIFFFFKLRYIVELQCCVTAVQKRDSVTHTHTHTLFFMFFFLMAYHRILNIVLCAIEENLVVYPF